MIENRTWNDKPLILAYHSVSDGRKDDLAVRVSDFAGQMAWLHRRGFKSMSLAQFMSEGSEKGERIAIITFDDGYADLSLYDSAELLLEDKPASPRYTLKSFKDVYEKRWQFCS